MHESSCFVNEPESTIDLLSTRTFEVVLKRLSSTFCLLVLILSQDRIRVDLRCSIVDAKTSVNEGDCKFKGLSDANNASVCIKKNQFSTGKIYNFTAIATSVLPGGEEVWGNASIYVSAVAHSTSNFSME